MKDAILHLIVFSVDPIITWMEEQLVLYVQTLQKDVRYVHRARNVSSVMKDITWIVMGCVVTATLILVVWFVIPVQSASIVRAGTSYHQELASNAIADIPTVSYVMRMTAFSVREDTICQEVYVSHVLMRDVKYVKKITRLNAYLAIQGTIS